MSYGEEQKRKNATKNKVIYAFLVLFLTNFTTYYFISANYQSKLISVVSNCEITKISYQKIVKLKPKIPTQKVFISFYEK